MFLPNCMVLTGDVMFPSESMLTSIGYGESKQHIFARLTKYLLCKHKEG